MKYLLLTLLAISSSAVPAMAGQATGQDKDIQILREEIYRQQLILSALKEKLSEIEQSVTP